MISTEGLAFNAPFQALKKLAQIFTAIFNSNASGFKTKCSMLLCYVFPETDADVSVKQKLSRR